MVNGRVSSLLEADTVGEQHVRHGSADLIQAFAYFYLLTFILFIYLFFAGLSELYFHQKRKQLGSMCAVRKCIALETEL